MLTHSLRLPDARAQPNDLGFCSRLISTKRVPTYHFFPNFSKTVEHKAIKFLQYFKSMNTLLHADFKGARLPELNFRGKKVLKLKKRKML